LWIPGFSIIVTINQKRNFHRTPIRASIPAAGYEGQVGRSEYLVISRGQWDKDIPKQEIQKAIDEFYVWLGRLVEEGKMKTGQRLATEGKTVSRKKVTDGPFGEAKEVVGGYWFIVAGSLEEAARIAAGNPCLKCGLVLEIRPIDLERASAFAITNETPDKYRKKRRPE
jgi:hypothetical protein